VANVDASITDLPQVRKRQAAHGYLRNLAQSVPAALSGSMMIRAKIRRLDTPFSACPAASFAVK